MLAAFLRGRRSSSNRWRVSLSQTTSVSPCEPPSWSPWQPASWSPWQPASWGPWQPAPWGPWGPARWGPWKPAPWGPLEEAPWGPWQPAHWDPREEAPWIPCKSSHSARWLGPSRQLGRPHSGRPQTHAKPAAALTSARHSMQTGPSRSREGPLTCGYSVRITSFRRIGLNSGQICTGHHSILPFLYLSHSFKGTCLVWHMSPNAECEGGWGLRGLSQ
jgi:hypothetical protein